MTSNTRLVRLPPVLAAAALMASLLPDGTLGAQAGKQRFTAFAANMSNVGTGRTGRVDVTIDRWTTDEEREQLRTALVENGTDALYRTLQKMKPVGHIRVNDSLGWDLRYAREAKTGSSRRIVFATDRPIDAWEARNQPRTIDYKFTFGELRLGPDGKGEGSLSPAVRVRYNETDRILDLENFASEPVRLLEVTALE
jgi:hypothetical protein